MNLDIKVFRDKNGKTQVCFYLNGIAIKTRFDSDFPKLLGLYYDLHSDNDDDIDSDDKE